jgi:hypothetical protein
MGELLDDLNQRIKALGGDWTKYTVVGSFLLYVLGYLTLRFHLTAIGVGTDLAVLDERYLFSGARFLVYLGSSVPIVVLIRLPVGLIAWAAIKVMPKRIAERGRVWVAADAASGPRHCLHRHRHPDGDAPVLLLQ